MSNDLASSIRRLEEATSTLETGWPWSSRYWILGREPGQSPSQEMKLSPARDCDLNEKRAKSRVEIRHSLVLRSERFLQLPGLEAVTICTPTHTHFEVASRTLEEGKNF